MIKPLFLGLAVFLFVLKWAKKGKEFLKVRRVRLKESYWKIEMMDICIMS